MQSLLEIFLWFLETIQTWRGKIQTIVSPAKWFFIFWEIFLKILRVSRLGKQGVSIEIFYSTRLSSFLDYLLINHFNLDNIN